MARNLPLHAFLRHLAFSSADFARPLCLPLHAAVLPALIRPPLLNFPRFHFLMKAYMCVICGHIYEEEKGDPSSGIAPGTRWEDVPLSWRCPDCGAGKEDFEMVEV